ncbi:unnamed protein product [Psylliodes chrysocephalus]|uniref:Uncharacterized protein n=1 Tax=Psylliodes chrysocephalus TaxID=3402493 RepID=A0A9P0CKC8_9CUCU|nr:unnamed protein product [Psylliodes chrysocephala]
MDEELEKYKCRLLEEMPLTDSQQIAIEEFKDKEEEGEEKQEEEVIEEKSEEEAVLEEPVAESIEIWIDAVPGIGPIVQDHLIKAVQEYMISVAAHQHNMVMPRNIRHYNCPPLEVVETN